MHAALSHLSAAEALLATGGKEEARIARLCGIRARVHGYLGEGDAAAADIHTAMRLVNPETSDSLYHLQTDFARVDALRNNFSAALDNLSRAETGFRQWGSSPGLLRIELHRGHILGTIGSREQAQRSLEAAAERARGLSHRRAEAKAKLFLGEEALLHGDTSEASEHFEFVFTSSLRDSSARLAACIHLSTLGREFPSLGRDLKALNIPDLRIAWLLMESERSNDPNLLLQARELSRGINLPLHLHRSLLYQTGHATGARVLEKQIAERLPRGALRRHFQQLIKRSTPDH